MPRTRTRNFATEAPKITAINRAVREPEQLNLDELLPGKVHGWITPQATEYGYVGRCECGWRTGERFTRAEAYTQLRRHLGRTPQGSVLLRTLRKHGRAGHGA